jgi:surface protein
MFTSKKNGNKIFLPYSGSYYDSKKPSDGTVTYYWTSTGNTNDEKKAWAVKLASGTATMTECQRRTGLPVRACAYEDDTPIEVPYAVVSSDKKTLTFYYDDQKDNRSGTKYSLNEGYSTPGWYNPASTITKVVFNSSFANARPTSCNSWFSNMKQLTTISGLNYLNTSAVTIMAGMFSSCELLGSINVSNFNTSKVIDMSGMFAGCKELTSVYFGEQFSTENARDFSSMFEGCETLSFLDLSGFKTENLENTERMFAGCKNLSSLNLENFDVRKLKNSSEMFEDCQTLKKVINPSKGELKL